MPCARRLSLPATIAIGGQTDWHGRAQNGARARSRALACASTALSPGLSSSCPSRWPSPPDTPMPSWFEIQWPASGGTASAGRLWDRCCAAHMTLESDASGLRLGRAAVAFGGGRAGFSDTQIVNVGGIDRAPGSRRLAEALARRTRTPSRWRITCAPPSSRWPSRLSGPVVSRRGVGLGGQRKAAGASRSAGPNVLGTHFIAGRRRCGGAVEPGIRAPAIRRRGARRAEAPSADRR